jgi:hypothetical protein
MKKVNEMSGFNVKICFLQLSHASEVAQMYINRVSRNTIYCWGQDSSGSVAIRCRLESPGVESRWVRDIPYSSSPVQAAQPVSHTMDTGSVSREIKRSGRGVDHPFRSSAEVKERVEL